MLYDYRRDHGHETNKCRSLKFMVKRLIKAGNLKRHAKEVVREAESGPLVEKLQLAWPYCQNPDQQ